MAHLAAKTACSSSRVALKAGHLPAACAVPVVRYAAPSSSGRRVLDFAPSCPWGARRGLKLTCRATEATTPTPVVKIDNTTDAFATIVTVDLGDQIVEMLETITALKNLGLNIRRAKVAKKGDAKVNTFYVTEATTSEKIVRSARLEEIRMTVIDSIVNEFPESSGGFNFGRVDYNSDSDNVRGGARPPRVVIPTTIDISEAPNGSCSVLKIVTSDRPGLLVDIVRVLKDVNMNVISAEVDTIGREAHDEFFVTYRGEPLASPMITLVTNSLQYYLSLAEVAAEESY